MFCNGQVKALIQEKCKLQVVLYGGMDKNVSKPICRSNKQLLETFRFSYCFTGSLTFHRCVILIIFQM